MHKKFSVVVPIFNEENNIKILLNEIIISLKEITDYEIIFVDDCSTDNSKKILESIENTKFIHFFSHLKNLGQSHSILTGIKNAKYQTIVTLDGDGQNNPTDIVKLLNTYYSSDKIYLVGGLRLNRKDNIIKIISSKIANWVRSLILRDNCSDTGCSLKVFEKDIFLKFPFFNGIHRFLPALFKGYGYNTKFISIGHRSRMSGISNYGTFNRLFKGIIDLIRVLIIIRKHKKTHD